MLSTKQYTENETLTMSQYKNLNLIGKGGFGKVYRYYYELDCQYYAVKKILLTMESANRALMEIRILSKLEHNNIVRYYHSWIETSSDNFDNDSSDEDTNYDNKSIQFQNSLTNYFLCIKMEYCNMTLSYYLRHEKYDILQRREFINQIIKGIFYLHENGYIHRDIKPDNILINSKNIIKISDFGLVKTVHLPFGSDKNTTYAGTFLYASPQQYDGKDYGKETDIYSLGIIFYELSFHFTTESKRIHFIQELKNGIIDMNIPNYKIILLMCSYIPSNRPTINQIYDYYIIQYEKIKNICFDIISEMINFHLI